MKTLKKALESTVPTLAVFVKAGEQDASVIKHTLDELRKAFADKAEFVMVDVSFDKKLKEAYKVESCPTWILFKDQAEVSRKEGDQGVDELTAMIESAYK